MIWSKCPLSPHPTICIVYIMEGSFIVPLCVELITTYMVMMMMITVTGGENKYFCIYCTFVTKKSFIFICTDAGSTCNVYSLLCFIKCFDLDVWTKK